VLCGWVNAGEKKKYLKLLQCFKASARAIQKRKKSRKIIAFAYALTTNI